MREKILFYWLSRAGHIGGKTYALLLDAYGNLEETYLEVKRGSFRKKKGLGTAVYQRLKKVADYAMLEEELERYEKKGIGFTYLTKSDFPERLKHIYSSPLTLFYKGQLPEREEPLIAVVGSRAPSEKGLYLAKKLSKELAESGIDVVSGMALGIDSSAHIGCMEGKGYTYAVLGCGVDLCYPKSNASLYRKIERQGGLISEYAPGVEPLKSHFPERNRIISGLVDGILVVEAREKSGSLITAELGLEQGKNIYAIPGATDFPLSEGTNRLIQAGAKLVMRTEDILEDFSFLLPKRRESGGECFGLSGMDSLVYSVLGMEPRHITAITEETGLTEAELFIILLKLELKGVVKRVGFEYYVGVL